jgi:hypothetical protein
MDLLWSSPGKITKLTVSDSRPYMDSHFVQPGIRNSDKSNRDAHSNFVSVEEASLARSGFEPCAPLPIAIPDSGQAFKTSIPN